MENEKYESTLHLKRNINFGFNIYICLTLHPIIPLLKTKVLISCLCPVPPASWRSWGRRCCPWRPRSCAARPSWPCARPTLGGCAHGTPCGRPSGCTLCARFHVSYYRGGLTNRKSNRSSRYRSRLRSRSHHRRCSHCSFHDLTRNRNRYRDGVGSCFDANHHSCRSFLRYHSRSDDCDDVYDHSVSCGGESYSKSYHHQSYS